MMKSRDWPYQKAGHLIRWEITAGPTSEPVSVSELKEHTRIDQSNEDTLLFGYIKTAREFVERSAGVLLMPQTVKVYFDEFPSDSVGIELPIKPVQSITQIDYIDTAGDSQTWSSANYNVDLVSFRPRITPTYTQDYPETKQQINAVTITLTAGYADVDSVPQRFKEAIMLLVAERDINRSNSAPVALTEIPYSVSALLNLDRNVIL